MSKITIRDLILREGKYFGGVPTWKKTAGRFFYRKDGATMLIKGVVEATPSTITTTIPVTGWSVSIGGGGGG